MDRDGDLVRLKRKVICCLSGENVVLSRTGDLSSMSKYLRWEKDTIIFAVVRLLDRINDIPQLAIKGSRKIADTTAAQVFNAYFTRYCSLAANTETQTPLAMDNCWTPKRRRKEISEDGESQGSLTPQVFEATSVKFRSP